jgi:hypothetical protein
MSFRSRLKKRQARIARESGQREQRSKYADRYYLTIVSRSACCNRCGGSLREGAECVYRHTPRTILCVVCADLERISYRPSMRWERRKRKGGKLVARSQRGIGGSSDGGATKTKPPAEAGGSSKVPDN